MTIAASTSPIRTPPAPTSRRTLAGTSTSTPQRVSLGHTGSWCRRRLSSAARRRCLTTGTSATRSPTGKCRTGDMGIGVVDGGIGGGPSVPGSPPAFPSGPEYRIWTDLSNNLGMGATIDAHYAAVSPDTTAPLVTIAPLTDCASVEQHSSTLVADFSCQEPGGLGSGVASCVGTDAAGRNRATAIRWTPRRSATASWSPPSIMRQPTSRRALHRRGQPATALALSNNVLDDHQPAADVGTSVLTRPGCVASLRAGRRDGSADNASFTTTSDTLKTATSDSELQPLASGAARSRVAHDDGGARSVHRQRRPSHPGHLQRHACRPPAPTRWPHRCRRPARRRRGRRRASR